MAAITMAYLLATNGLDQGQLYKLVHGENQIGRESDCQVHLDLPSVSRYHVNLIVDDSHFTITDLNSVNGTKVNGHPVTNPVSLKSGDTVQIADLDFSFVLEPPAVSPAQAELKSMDFKPTAAMDTLQLRSDLLTRLRAFFDREDFLEVETPLLSADTIVDRYLYPLSVVVDQRTYWLQTSPEFHMKRLLASGMNSIYQVTRAFRGSETGRHHNLEFTMVEWYRVGQTTASAMELLGELAMSLLDYDGFEVLTYQQAFMDTLAIDPLHCSTEELLHVIAGLDFQPPENWRNMDRDHWLDLLLSEWIQPKLGVDKPAILYDYPASQAALARLKPGEPEVAERFELYVDGVELANGYHELQDVDEFRRRMQQANQQRVKDEQPCLPEESYLELAMQQGLPDCCGVALGFDRLVMLAAGVATISDVLTFPFDRA
ncbi:MAG: EF-P lysine aminoacylase EpmA [Planctomycetota bacterium]|nr:EF-P lysine aminoacylase EpmA [Planctomycetota bacterium]